MDRRRFLARCEPADLVFAEVLAEPRERIRHAYSSTEGFKQVLIDRLCSR